MSTSGAPRGYLGTRQIRTDRRVQLPRMLREHPLGQRLRAAGRVHWGVTPDDVPCFSAEEPALPAAWREAGPVSFTEPTEVHTDAIVAIAGAFFAGYTPPGYAQLPASLHPEPVPSAAQLAAGERIHFIATAPTEGVVVQLMRWEELLALPDAAFAELLPTYAQWSELLDNITYDETMANPGVPGQVLERAIGVFDHVRDGPPHPEMES